MSAFLVVVFTGLTIVIGYQNCAKTSQEGVVTKPAIGFGYATSPSVFMTFSTPTAQNENPACRTPEGARDCTALIVGRLYFNEAIVKNKTITACIKTPTEAEFYTGSCRVLITDNDGNIQSSLTQSGFSETFCSAADTQAYDTGMFLGDIKGTGPSVAVVQTPLFIRKNIASCPALP